MVFEVLMPILICGPNTGSHLHGVVGPDPDQVFDQLSRVLEVNVCCKQRDKADVSRRSREETRR